MKANQEWFEKTTKEYEQIGYWEPLTLGEQLRIWAKKYQNKIALVEGDYKLTYMDLDHSVDKVASGFFNMGITKGDAVVVQLPNRISFAITCFALFRIGAFPILSMPAHRETELNGIFALAKPIAYIIPDTFLGFDYRKMADELVKKHSCIKFVITDGDNESGFKLRDISMPPMDLDPPSYTDTALLLLSGGTTGIPKLIPRTHADYAYNAKASAIRCQLNSESVYLATLPIAHNFPLACPGMFGTLSVGGKVVLCKTTSADEAFPLIEKERITITALVPAVVNLWLQVLEWDTSDISSLKVLQVGGSPLSEDLAKRIMSEMTCKLQQVFGMAEGLVCYTSLDDPAHVIHNCQGRPLSDHDEIRIIGKNGNNLPQGETGELIVRGPYTIREYYRAPEQNLKDFTPYGFYCSGDMARITKEGNIQIKGRIKEQINRAGEKIMSAEIESYLCAHHDIKEAALIALPDETLGEKSCAFLISDNSKITLTDIHQLFNDMGVAHYKVPDQIEFMDFWPLTSVGKVNKQKLADMITQSSDKTEDLTFSYMEKSIDFSGDPLLTASQIIEDCSFENYMLYENKEEWSLGMGIHALLSVDSDNTILKIGNEKLRFANGVLSDTIDKAFLSLPLKDWRAYGTANFGLSRYNHKLPHLSEDKYLLELFVPEVEVRFTKGSILLRALQKEQLETLYKLVRTISDINQNKYIEKKFTKRLSEKKLEVLKISTHESEDYKRIVENAVKEIRQPQYQKVILSRKIPLNRELDMIASYIAGRKANSPARSFLLSLNGLKAAGFNPETVVEVKNNGWVSTQPLAGTRTIGRNDDEEARLRKELLNDSKEIAEHAISIKLAFEEMESICESGTIVVSDFMSIARRGTVQHIASRLKGKLKTDCNPWHAFNALFPAVTASGIPKKEAIEAIGRFESVPRNLYSGCVMTFDSDGTMDAALVLRSFFQKNNNAWLHAGAGIVEMSEPSRELEETCEKLKSVSGHMVYAR